MMNLKEIKEVIQLMNENSLTEIEIEKDGLRIRLKKGAGGMIETNFIPVESAARAPQAGGGRLSESMPKDAASAAQRASIKSPMVGTFYSSPAPDAAPFIQVGTQVEPGQVICIIEAMKLMNEIKSEVRGKIAEILVHNGDPVEFGQPLFIIE